MNLENCQICSDNLPDVTFLSVCACMCVHPAQIVKFSKTEMTQVLSHISWTLQSPLQLADNNGIKIPDWTLRYGINCHLVFNKGNLRNFPCFQTFSPFFITYFYLETLFHFSWSSFFLSEISWFQEISWKVASLFLRNIKSSTKLATTKSYDQAWGLERWHFFSSPQKFLW